MTPWTVALQALPSMGFSRQEHWSGLPFPSPGQVNNILVKVSIASLSSLALKSYLHVQ